jgi:hypothetical protein
MIEKPKDRDQAAKILEEWIRFRELQGWTREAAKAELAAASKALLVAEPRKEGYRRRNGNRQSGCAFLCTTGRNGK